MSQDNVQDLQYDLTDVPTHDLVIGMVERFNDMVASIEKLEEDNELLRLATDKGAAAIEELKALKGQHDKLGKQYNEMATTAERLTLELAKKQDALALAQKQLTEYKQKGVDQLRTQVKRLQESNEKLTTRNNTLNHENSQIKRDLTKTRQDGADRAKQLLEKVDQAEKDLAFWQGSGIFHKGPHHLIVWPKPLEINGKSGIYLNQGLLYMHQSGRAALVTYDPETGIQMAANPPGGLKMSDDCLNFANEWLYKVNILQDGKITDLDMVQINHNT